MEAARDLTMSAAARERRKTSIDVLEERVDTLIKNFDDEREEARKHRQALREVIAALSLSVTTLTERVAEIKPVVDDYKEKRAEARGAAKLGRFLWTAGIAAAGLVGALIGKKL